MKKLLFILPVLFSISYAQTKKPSAKPVEKKDTKKIVLSPMDSLSYAMGVQFAEYYKSQGAREINAELVKKACDDVYNNRTLIMSPEVADLTIQKKIQEYMLEENKKKSGVVTLPDGLQYEIITPGTGPIPKATDTVKANYMGSLINGKEFDNSYKRGQALTIPVSGVIRGWVEALQLMPVGSKWKLFVSSDLGYGDRGAGGGAILGGSTLIFEIELLDILHKP